MMAYFERMITSASLMIAGTPRVKPAANHRTGAQDIAVDEERIAAPALEPGLAPAPAQTWVKHSHQQPPAPPRAAQPEPLSTGVPQVLAGTSEPGPAQANQNGRRSAQPAPGPAVRLIPTMVEKAAQANSAAEPMVEEERLSFQAGPLAQEKAFTLIEETSAPVPRPASSPDEPQSNMHSQAAVPAKADKAATTAYYLEQVKHWVLEGETPSLERSEKTIRPAASLQTPNLTAQAQDVSPPRPVHRQDQQAPTRAPEELVELSIGKIEVVVESPAAALVHPAATRPSPRPEKKPSVSFLDWQRRFFID